MCENKKYVHNRYIHKSVLVSCGHCPSCQQEKANARAMRIRNHNDGRLCLFVTLTYDNRFVPYIETSDLLNISDSSVKEVQIKRDYSVRWYKDNCIIKENPVVLTSYRQCDFETFCFGVPELKMKLQCTGVIYWPDVQNFIKRLRINLKRKYNYDSKISYYACGEYGSDTKRCHFHLLIYFEQGTFEEIQPVIVKSWPYGDMQRENKRIQIALDPSSYVASYTAKSASLPKILESAPIRPKYSHSLYFGLSLSAFSLPSLLEKADKNDMCYRKEVLKDGVPVLVDVPIPKYVLNRFFPKFKGYSSFTTPEIHELLRFPQKLWNKLGKCDLSSHIPLIGEHLLYSREDFRRFIVHLNHCFETYKDITNKNIYDYSIDYCRVWQSRQNYIFKHSYDNIETLLDFKDFYENANEFVDNPDLSPTLLHPSVLVYQVDPNKRDFEICKDKKLKEQYDRKENLKMINNMALSAIDNQF